MDDEIIAELKKTIVFDSINKMILPHDQHAMERVKDRTDAFERVDSTIFGIFSSFRQIVKTFFILMIVAYVLFAFITAISSLPEGSSLTTWIFVKHFMSNFKVFRNLPLINKIADIFENVFSPDQAHFILFVGAFSLTFFILYLIFPE